MLYGLRRHPDRLDRHPGVKAELTALGFSWNVPKKGPKGPRRKKKGLPQVLKPSLTAGVSSVADGEREGEVMRREENDGVEQEVVEFLSRDHGGEDDTENEDLDEVEFLSSDRGGEDITENEDLDLDLVEAESDSIFSSSRREKSYRPFELEGMMGAGMTESMRIRLEENLMARKQQHQRRLRKAVALGVANGGDAELERHREGINNGEEGIWGDVFTLPEEEGALTSSPLGRGRRKVPSRPHERDSVAAPASV